MKNERTVARILVRLASIASAFALIAEAGTAQAQTGDATSLATTTPVPGEIIVTAQKREQNVQKVGISITALGKDTLAAIGRQDVTALENQVPSLAVNQYSPTITIFNIRGVSQSDFTDAQEAPIAFYDDEVYVASLGAITGMNFDLERVEVLRGPQGTLFGRNATGGLVQFVSTRPTKQTEGFLTLTTGSFGQFATEGAISGPLTDNFQARLSFTTNNSNGYITNINPNNNGKLGNANFWAIRAQLAWQPTIDDKFNLKFQVLRNAHERNAGLYSWAAATPDSHGVGSFAPPGTPDAGGFTGVSSNPFIQDFNRNPMFNRTYYQVTGRYEHDFGWGSLTSITDYQNLRKYYAEDSDMSPNTLAEYTTSQKFHQISQELRLAGSTNSLHWVAGAYGLSVHSANTYQYLLFPATFGVLNYGGPLKTNSIAGFGQVEYSITPTVSVIGGLRYSYDKKTDDFSDYFNGVKIFQWSDASPEIEKFRHKSFSNWSGKAEVDYKPNDNTLIYASVNRGTKSGGFGVFSSPAGYTADPAAAAAQGLVLVSNIPFDQEVLTNFEAGFKLTLLDHTTHFNASAFHYNYQKYQAFQNIGTNQVITNNQAYISGAEFELNTRPMHGLYLGAFFTVLNTKVKNFSLPDGTLVDPQMPQAPKTSGGFNVHYDFQAGSGRLGLTTDWRYEGEQYLEALNAPDDRAPPRIVGNVRVSYALHDGKYELAGFIYNVTDKWYRVYNLDLAAQLGSANQTFARPRTWGVSLTAKY